MNALEMISEIKNKLRKTPVRLAVMYARTLVYGSDSQSQESAILERLLTQLTVPKSFVEFGFHINQFNCARLREGYRGLLIDGDPQAVRIARRFLPLTIEAKSVFLTLDNLDIVERAFPPGDFGILSIDVDGNDYWFLERLIKIKPSVIIVEYNASFGLRHITVPYDPCFMRHEKHSSGWYHGASITALTSIAAKAEYSLVEVDPAGANLFFVRDDIKPNGMATLAPAEAYKENAFRNKWSSTTATQQWAAIMDLPYIEVS